MAPQADLVVVALVAQCESQCVSASHRIWRTRTAAPRPVNAPGSLSASLSASPAPLRQRPRALSPALPIIAAFPRRQYSKVPRTHACSAVSFPPADHPRPSSLSPAVYDGAVDWLIRTGANLEGRNKVRPALNSPAGALGLCWHLRLRRAPPAQRAHDGSARRTNRRRLLCVHGGRNDLCKSL